MQHSSLVRTGTTSKWFATNPRPNPSVAGRNHALNRTRRARHFFVRSSVAARRLA
jgi:hypothetical protein